MEMTPLKISILIHYYCSPTDIYNVDSPAAQEAIEEFMQRGLMNKTKPGACAPHQKYQANRDAIKVYIEAIEKVPLPIPGWIIPHHHA